MKKLDIEAKICKKTTILQKNINFEKACVLKRKFSKMQILKILQKNF